MSRVNLSKILNHMTGKDEWLDKSLRDAAIEGDLDKIKDILQKGADINAVDSHGESAFHKAIFFEKISCADYLLRQGIDVNHANVNKKTALHIAVEYGRFESVKYLLANGADWTLRDEMGRNAFEMAKSTDPNLTAEFFKSYLDSVAESKALDGAIQNDDPVSNNSLSF